MAYLLKGIIMTTKITKVTVNLPEKEIELLQRIAREENLTFTDILIRAIKAEEFFVQSETQGNRLFIEKPNKKRFLVIRK